MTRSTRKFVAVLMLLWLPLFSGSALAASISMQTPQGACHEAAGMQAMSDMSMMDMDGMDMGEHHDSMPATADDHGNSNNTCNTCGVCHLACTAYLAMPGVTVTVAQTAARETTPYLVAFHSFTSVPLLPPPLVRA